MSPWPRRRHQALRPLMPTSKSLDLGYDKKIYSLTIEFRSAENGTVLFGSVTWVEEHGKHTVKSPIVLALAIETW